MSAPTRVWPAAEKVVRELRRGAHMLRVGGARAGLRFVREEVVANAWIRLREGHGVSAERARVECNLCGWRGSRFLTHCSAGYVDRNSFCPRCRSYARHRGFAFLLEHELAPEFARLARSGGRRILFAPEPGMASLLAGRLERIEGADLDGGREGVTLVEDLQALSLPAGAVDFAAAFHVLEHVPDDRKALSELARVLSPTGRLLLCVPMSFERSTTLEFGEARADLNEHWRDYGLDFAARLHDAGLRGRSFRLRRDVPPETFERLALIDEELHWLSRS
jgi:SAM-dependent methyltransferase